MGADSGLNLDLGNAPLSPLLYPLLFVKTIEQVIKMFVLWLSPNYFSLLNWQVRRRSELWPWLEGIHRDIYLRTNPAHPMKKKKREKEKVTIFFCRQITCVQLWCLSDITSDPADSTGRILLQGSRHILNALSQRLSRSCLVPPIRRYYVSLTTRTPCAGPLNWLVIYLSQALR